MASHPTPRVIRAYSLPVAQFDHLKAFQRYRQLTINRAGESRDVTNSEALACIVRHHELISTVAGLHNLMPDEFASALYLGDLKVSRP